MSVSLCFSPFPWVSPLIYFFFPTCYSLFHSLSVSCLYLISLYLFKSLMPFCLSAYSSKTVSSRALPCLETIEIRTQNLRTIIKNHKAHTDTDINPDRQDKTSSSFPPEMEKISLSRFFWGGGGGAGGQAGFGKELRVWNCI